MALDSKALAAVATEWISRLEMILATPVVLWGN